MSACEGIAAWVMSPSPRGSRIQTKPSEPAHVRRRLAMNDRRLTNPSVLALGFAFAACAGTPQPTALPPAPAVRTPAVAHTASPQLAAGSVFLKPSPLPYELPEFDKIH